MIVPRPMLWKGIRSAIVTLSFISVFFSSASYSSVQIGWFSVVIAFCFFPTLMLVSVSVLLVIRGKRFNWEPPSWRTNPFNFSHGEHFFHLASWVIMAQGLAMLMQVSYLKGSVSVAGMVSISFGAGIWFGLWALTRIYYWQAA